MSLYVDDEGRRYVFITIKLPYELELRKLGALGLRENNKYMLKYIKQTQYENDEGPEHEYEIVPAIGETPEPGPDHPV